MVLVMAIIIFSAFMVGIMLGHRESEKFYSAICEDKHKAIIQLINKIRQIEQENKLEVEQDPADWWKKN